MFQDANKLVVFGSQLVGVLIVIIGLTTQQAKLRTPRPPTTTPGIIVDNAEPSFFARLWDDPLEMPARQPPKTESPSPNPSTVSTASTSSASDSPAPAHSSSPVPSPTATKSPDRTSKSSHPCSPSISSILTPSPGPPSPTPAPASPAPTPTPAPASPVPTLTSQTTATASPTSPEASPDPDNLVIWNVLDASPVAEIRERRLRIRYASVSAVLTAGYLPLRESRLTRLVDKDSVVLTEKGPMEKLIGSFETFGFTDKSAARFERTVTFVWTAEEPLEKTVNRVKAQVADANKKTSKAKPPTAKEPKIYVLHHGSSEDRVNYAAASGKWPYDTFFMQATISPTQLGNEPESWRSQGITTDDLLVDALLKELSVRIPALNRAACSHDDPPRIVVITESDTGYSQAIYKELEKKFRDKANLEFFSYLRGLDGRSENVATTPETSKQASYDTADLILQGWGIVEKSSGTPQFDYLRRLALHLRATTKKWNGREVAAVGVLGTDIYDKILVLQAVRRALPSAIFFTTDLDAVYLEQDYQSVTRNLVVASADSLSTDSPNVSKKLPPMRDSYQTVLAKKVRDLLPQPTSTPGQTPTPTRAQVFEIALGRSIALDASSGAGSCILRYLSHPWANGPIFALALLNAFLILGAVFTRDANSTNAPMEHWARAIVHLQIFAASAGIVWLIILYVFAAENEQWLGEPLALGVSIWPSVMIRLLAFLVAILLLRLASRSLVMKSKEVRGWEELKKLPSLNNQTRPARDLAKRFYHSVEQTCGRLFDNVVLEKATASPEQPFEIHLTTFFGSNNPRVWWRDPRLWRLIKYSAIYFAISACLFWIWPPSVPGRGAGALLIEKIVLALGVTLYIVHLIFCLDLHIGAFRFIRAFQSSYDSKSWPETATKFGINGKSMLEATSVLTEIIGKTLLYPLTVLILIILSRLRNFDNWVMTPSLTITFSLGAVLLVTASLVLWLEGSRMKKKILAKHRKAYEEDVRAAAAAQLRAEDSNPKEGVPAAVTDAAAKDAAVKDATLAKEKREAAQKVFDKEKADLDAINDGVFAAWYNQPIFAALLSAAAVFGSLSVAGPIARLFLS